MTLEPFRTVTGPAAAMPGANIDTDVIMPKQFLKGVDRGGLASGVFYSLRNLADGSPNPAFVLNQPAWRESRFLVVGPNFGCGSSREHAVWGLGQLGVRAIIGTTFADIFFDNCAHNGLLAIKASEETVQRLLAYAGQPDRCVFTVDLANQAIRLCDGVSVPFDIESARKRALIEGLNLIDLTLLQADQIRRFEASRYAASPWLGGPE